MSDQEETYYEALKKMFNLDSGFYSILFAPKLTTHLKTLVK